MAELSMVKLEVGIEKLDVARLLLNVPDEYQSADWRLVSITPLTWRVGKLELPDAVESATQYVGQVGVLLLTFEKQTQLKTRAF